MASKYLALLTSLLHLATAQKASIVPQDLSTDFSSSDTQVQVSYTNEAVNGFADGTTFSKDAVSKEPTFALGDSSGITPGLLFTIIMIDTTCPDQRTLHYARANFQTNNDITNIVTSSAALVDYKAPGAFGETGDNRQYTFLMYTNPRRSQISSLKLPTQGQAFDVEQFQKDNGLSDASAGVGMVVKLGGTANCGGATPSGGSDSVSSAKPLASSSAAKATSAGAGTTTSAAVASSSVGAGAGAGATSSAITSRVSSAASRIPTSSSSSSSGDNSDSSNGNGPASSGGQTSGLVAATSVLQPDGPEPSTLTSTVILSSGLPEGTSRASKTATSSGNAALQTANAAPGSVVVGGKVIAPLFAVIGLIVL